MKQSLPKWCYASIADHFETRKQDLKLFVEGDVRNTNMVPTWAELRIDGPFFTEVSKDYWYVDVEINTFVETTVNDRDAYLYLKNIGIMLKAFTPIIKVFRFGTESIDDSSLVGCLKLRQEFREKLVVSHFGITDPGAKIRQSQIEGHYRMELMQNIN